jgi:hypothetical protein
VPGGTPLVANDGVDPSVTIAAFPKPGDVPASSRYAVAGSPVAGALHVRETVDPFTVTAGVPGAPGRAPVAPTVRKISLEGALVPQSLAARTRMKYVPAGAAACSAVVGDGTGTTARLL